MAPEAVPIADVRQWRRRTRSETRPGPARYVRDAARSRRLRPADDLRHHRALVPKRADHREALPRPQCRSCRCRHRPARIAGAQGRDEGLIVDRPNLILAAACSHARCCGAWRSNIRDLSIAPYRAPPTRSQRGPNPSWALSMQFPGRHMNVVKDTRLASFCRETQFILKHFLEMSVCLWTHA